MNNSKSFTTAEVCEMFNISKSTLFRWEQSGKIPNVPRDINNQRQYTQKHINSISARQRLKLKRRFRESVEAADSNWEILESISLRKFMEGNIIGLQELAERETLSVDTIHKVVQFAVSRYEPSDEEYCEAMHVAWRGSRLLSAQVGIEVGES